MAQESRTALRRRILRHPFCFANRLPRGLNEPMLTLGRAASVVLLLLIGCSVPELEQREAKITMAPWPKETNVVSLSSSAKPLTLREAREARGKSNATPFSRYDDKVLGGIRRRWWDQSKTLPRRSGGEVILNFKMTYDGKVADMKVDGDVPEPYAEACKKAVLDGVPYEPWPGEMRRLIGNSRDVTLRFYYRGDESEPGATNN